MIVRIQKRTNPYAQIDKRPLENPDLSWKAKGLLAYLLAKPDDWQIRMEQLANASTDGMKAVRSALAELKEAGHAELKVEHDGEHATGKRWVIKELTAEMTKKAKSAKATDIAEKVTSPKEHATNNKTSEKENKPIISDDLFSEEKFELPPPLNTPEIEAAWLDWEKVRRENKKALTPTTRRMQIRELIAMGAARALAALKHSAKNGFTGLYEPNQGRTPTPEKRHEITKDNALR
jgi:hypothetical protein